MKSSCLTVFLAVVLLASCNRPYGPLPDEAQLKWHSLEYYMFCHFGPNTFTDKEWGDGTEQPEIFNPSALDCEQWAQVAEMLPAEVYKSRQ